MPSATDVRAHERAELEHHPLDVVGVHEVGGVAARSTASGSRPSSATVAGLAYDDATVGVDHERGVGRVLDERAEAVLAVAGRGLGVLLLLPRGAGHADHERRARTRP